jgi:hypothetical protein
MFVDDVNWASVRWLMVRHRTELVGVVQLREHDLGQRSASARDREQLAEWRSNIVELDRWLSRLDGFS